MEDLINWKHAEAICNAKLIELGYETFFPFTGGTEIDLIAVKEGKLYTIQIKSVSPKGRDKITAHLYRSKVNFKKYCYKAYENIDWFLIYDGINIYKVNSKETNISITLRYKLPKNNQKKNIKMAKNYILK